MIRLHTLLSLIKKELLNLIDNPATAIAFIVFNLIWQFLFFRNVFLVGESSLRILYDYLPWLLILLTAAVTMGIFSQEKNEGTLELLLTHPVKELEIVCSKFIASWILVSFALLFTIPIAIAFSQFGIFDWGAFISQTLSGIFLTGSLLTLGIFLSSLLTSPIATLLVTSASSFFLIIAGSDFLTANLPLSFVPLFERLSLLSHTNSMARGVIDIRDLWYFVSFIVIFLSLTYLLLLRQKFGNRRDYYWRYQVGMFLFIGIAIVSNIVGSRIPGRLDLTRNQDYSISVSTRKILENLNDIVTITFYASSRLPSQLTPVVRDVRDLLRDYQQYSKGNISIIQKDPSNNQEIISEATSRGVREVQFNVIGQEEFQVKTGLVGIVVSYGDKHEAIPLIQQTGDLEYQLTSLIAKLTTKDKKKIAFLSGHGEKSLQSDYSIMDQELQKQFTVETVTDIASEAAVLVVAGPTQAINQSQRDALSTYLKTGKSAFFLIDTYTINPQTLAATKNEHSFADFLNIYGVSISSDITYDLRSNETIRMGQGGMSVLRPYPFWIRALKSKTQSPIVNRLNGVSLPWPASINENKDVLTNQNLKSEILLTTSPFANIQSDNINLNPNALALSQNNTKEFALALSVGKIVVVGDSEFLTDEFIRNAPDNLTFALSVLSYLSEQNSLADIRVKQSASSKLVFNNAMQMSSIKYGNILISTILPIGFVLARLFKRRSLRNKRYSKDYL